MKIDYQLSSKGRHDALERYAVALPMNHTVEGDVDAGELTSAAPLLEVTEAGRVLATRTLDTYCATAADVAKALIGILQAEEALRAAREARAREQHAARAKRWLSESHLADLRWWGEEVNLSMLDPELRSEVEAELKRRTERREAALSAYLSSDLVEVPEEARPLFAGNHHVWEAEDMRKRAAATARREREEAIAAARESSRLSCLRDWVLKIGATDQRARVLEAESGLGMLPEAEALKIVKDALLNGLAAFEPYVKLAASDLPDTGCEHAGAFEVEPATSLGRDAWALFSAIRLAAPDTASCTARRHTVRCLNCGETKEQFGAAVSLDLAHGLTIEREFSLSLDVVE